MSSVRPRAPSHGMPREKLFLLWEDMVREKELPVLNPTSALEGALTIRYVRCLSCLLAIGVRAKLRATKFPCRFFGSSSSKFQPVNSSPHVHHSGVNRPRCE